MGQSRYKKKTGKARRLVGDILRKRRRSKQAGGAGFVDTSSLMIAKELVLIKDKGVSPNSLYDRVTFTNNYIPAAGIKVKNGDTVDIEMAKRIFTIVFGGTGEKMSLDFPVLPCANNDDGVSRDVITIGLQNRFLSLAQEIILLESTQKDTSVLRTKLAQLDALRELIKAARVVADSKCYDYVNKTESEAAAETIEQAEWEGILRAFIAVYLIAKDKSNDGVPGGHFDRGTAASIVNQLASQDMSHDDLTAFYANWEKTPPNNTLGIPNLANILQDAQKNVAAAPAAVAPPPQTPTLFTLLNGIEKAYMADIAAIRAQDTATYNILVFKQSTVPAGKDGEDAYNAGVAKYTAIEDAAKADKVQADAQLKSAIDAFMAQRTRVEGNLAQELSRVTQNNQIAAGTLVVVDATKSRADKLVMDCRAAVVAAQAVTSALLPTDAKKAEADATLAKAQSALASAEGDAAKAAAEFKKAETASAVATQTLLAIQSTKDLADIALRLCTKATVSIAAAQAAEPAYTTSALTQKISPAISTEDDIARNDIKAAINALTTANARGALKPTTQGIAALSTAEWLKLQEAASTGTPPTASAADVAAATQAAAEAAAALQAVEDAAAGIEPTPPPASTPPPPGPPVTVSPPPLPTVAPIDPAAAAAAAASPPPSTPDPAAAAAAAAAARAARIDQERQEAQRAAAAAAAKPRPGPRANPMAPVNIELSIGKISNNLTKADFTPQNQTAYSNLVKDNAQKKSLDNAFKAAGAAATNKAYNITTGVTTHSLLPTEPLSAKVKPQLLADTKAAAVTTLTKALGKFTPPLPPAFLAELTAISTKRIQDQLDEIARTGYTNKLAKGVMGGGGCSYHPLVAMSLAISAVVAELAGY